MKKVIIKILDEVNCIIIGLIPDHIEWFVKQYAKFAPNYFFNPKFKLGSWDGKIKYFYKSGKTFTYLLPEIVPILKAFGYKIELIDLREFGVNVDFIDKNHFAHIKNPENDEPFILRYYQVDGVNALIENGGGVILAATGSGKTFMDAALCDTYNKQGLKTLTIVPSQDLIVQTKNDFVSLKLDTGEYSGDLKDLNHQHIISTWQALQNNPNIVKMFQVVVVDECHGAKSQVLKELLINHGKNIQYRFGLTGTLPKAETDAMTVHIAAGPVVYEIPAHQLQSEGYLANMHIDIYQLEENLTNEYQEFLKHTDFEGEKPPTYTTFKNSYYPEWNQEKSHLNTYKPRLEWIKEFIEVKKNAKKGNVFCLVDSIPFGKRLAKMIDDAVFVYGKDKKEARKQIYELFRDNNNLVVIANVQIASTGLNIKRIFNMMFIDIGKSFIRTIQTIGRGLRKAEDKDFVNVSDICSDLKYGKRHLTDRTKYYREACYPYKKHVVKYDE